MNVETNNFLIFCLVVGSAVQKGSIFSQCDSMAKERKNDISLYKSTLDDSTYPDLPFVNSLELNISDYVDVAFITLIRKLIGDKICPEVFVFGSPVDQVRTFRQPQKVLTILRFCPSEDSLGYLNKHVALTPCNVFNTFPLLLKRLLHQNNTYEFCCHLRTNSHPESNFRISNNLFKLVVRFRRKQSSAR